MSIGHTTLLVDTLGAGVEEIQRAGWYQLVLNLNEAIDTINAAWLESDRLAAETVEADFVPVEVEYVEIKDFHEGHRPSLISAPITEYPNVAVMTYRATPGPGGEAYDHQDKYRVTLAVEAMVKAGPEEGEVVCTRRAHRMMQAINHCMMTDPTLGGHVSGFDAAPTLSLGDLFTRKEKTAYGPHWYWQGSRLEYVVRKESTVGSTQQHGNVRVSSYPGLEIDQA